MEIKNNVNINNEKFCNKNSEQYISKLKNKNNSLENENNLIKKQMKK